MRPQETEAASALDRERVRLERLNDEIELGKGAIAHLCAVRALAANEARRRGLVPMLQGAALRNDNGDLAKAQREIARLLEENADLKLRLTEATENSNRDGLTGVLGRRGFDQLLEKEWARSRRAETPLGLLFVDVDRFKQVNDEHGHLAGDEALRAIADAIGVEARRSGETVARYGGDELVVMLPGTPLEGVLAVGERIRASVAELRLMVDEEAISLSVSIGGGAVVPHHKTKSDTLIALADKAMYQAKHGGRNACVGAAYEESDVGFFRPVPPVEPDETGRVTEISSKTRRTR